MKSNNAKIHVGDSGIPIVSSSFPGKELAGFSKSIRIGWNGETYIYTDVSVSGESLVYTTNGSEDWIQQNGHREIQPIIWNGDNYLKHGQIEKFTVKRVIS